VTSAGRAGTLPSMAAVDVRRTLSDTERAEIEAFVAPTGGERALSDHLWLDLRAGGRPGFVAVIARRDGAVSAYAQLSATNEGLLFGVAGSPDDPGWRAAAAAALATARGRQVEWWVTNPGDGARQLAADHGLMPGRQLLQMRRPLPLDEASAIETRPFRPGIDEEAWLAVNNAAFAEHPEQGGWDLATLRLREGEPWFDPAGFLMHELDGRVAGFCWTKVHAELDPPAGEIYVIAVDPAFHGRGLGKQLTIAGLAHLAERGITVGMLYVDAANAAAVGLYRRLGFTVHREDQAFTGMAQ
jgi:mycothiol synthase